MDLKVNEYQLPEIKFANFEEVRAELATKIETYKNMVYTESDIKAAKADRADLNKMKKAINDDRIAREKEWMKPFEPFKKQVNEIIALIDEPIKVIDAQVKAFETKQKEEKENQIRDMFAQINVIDWLTLDKIFDSKWLNASASINSVLEDMRISIETIKNNFDSLTGLEYEFEAKETFKATLSLSQAVNENRRLAELAAKKAEAERARAEMEKAKAEVKEEPKAEPKEEPKVEEPKVIEIAPVEEKKADEPRELMTLKVKINMAEYDALTAWLDEQGIDWSME